MVLGRIANTGAPFFMRRTKWAISLSWESAAHAGSRLKERDMLKRIFSNVVTRVAVGVILAAIFAIVGSNKARASTHSDQGQAYAACRAHQQTAIIGRTDLRPGSCRLLPVAPATPSRYDCYLDQRFGADPWNPDNAGCESAYFTAGQTCQQRPEQTVWSPATAVCHQGCKYFGFTDAGTTYFSTCNDTNPDPSAVTCGAGSFGVCTAADVPPPVLDTDGDGEPDDTDAFPNDPTETSDSDGDGIGDNADFAPEDPTDGEDTEGEEDGDDEGDNTASGGATCAAPPACKGDGIACAQLYQVWRLRCQGTAQGTVTGSVMDCNAVVTVVSPDPVANAQLVAARRSQCLLEQIAGQGGEGGGAQGDANGNGVADVLEGAGNPGTEPETPDTTDFNIGISPDMLDVENIFGGGSCPNAPSFQIWTVTISPSSMPYWCQMMAIARALILIFGMWTACQILMGRVI